MATGGEAEARPPSRIPGAVHARVTLASLLVLALAVAAAVAAAGASARPAARAQAAYLPAGVLAAANQLRAVVGERPLAAGSFAALDGEQGSWLVEPDHAIPAVQVMAGWDELLAQLLDPRTTTGAAEQRADNVVALALGTDSSLPLVDPVLPRRLDPASPLGIAVLLPARPGAVRLYEQRPSGEKLLQLRLVRTPAAGGAWLARLTTGDEDGVRLAYGTRYRLVVDGMSWSYTTPPIPRAYLARSWRWGASMTPARRALYLRAVASAPAFARQIVKVLDGAITVFHRACDNEDSSCAEYDEWGAYTLSIAPADFADTFADMRFVTLHELGHMVDYMAFLPDAYAPFRALFQQSPRWKSCFPDDTSDTGCVDFSEIFADQFAYWATGLPADPSGGYGDPPLASPAAFEKLLREQWAFRPPVWRNPAVPGVGSGVPARSSGAAG